MGLHTIHTIKLNKKGIIIMKAKHRLITLLLIIATLAQGTSYYIGSNSYVWVNRAQAIDGSFTNNISAWADFQSTNSSEATARIAGDLAGSNDVDTLQAELYATNTARITAESLKLDKTGDTAGSLTVTNLIAINAVNNFANSNFKAGYNAADSASGDYNSYLGPYAGYEASGNYNGYLGTYAGKNASGDYNNYLGSYAGYRSISTNNLYLGKYSGQYQTNNNRAYFGNYETINCNTARVVNISAGINANEAVNLGQVQAMTNGCLQTSGNSKIWLTAESARTNNCIYFDGEYFVKWTRFYTNSTAAVTNEVKTKMVQ